jgi:HlyD family secretion protein
MFSRIKKWIFPVLSILILTTLGLSLVKNLSAPPTTSPRANDLAKSDRTAIPKSGGDDTRLPLPKDILVSANGVVEPRSEEVEFSAQVSGVIAEVLVKEGQEVDMGTPLVRLEDGLQRAVLAATQADLAAAEAQYKRARKGNRAPEIEDARAQAEAAKAQLESSQTDLERQKQLLRDNVIAQDEFDRTRFSADQLQAQYTASQARARLVASGSRSEDVAIALAQRDAASARVDQAQRDVDLRTVKAPFSGRILSMDAHPGEYYSPGSANMGVIGDVSSLRVRLEVDERDIGKVKLGQLCRIQTLPFPDQLIEGSVTEIGQRLGPKKISTDSPGELQDTKVLEVLVDLPNPGALISGLRVRGYLSEAKP